MKSILPPNASPMMRAVDVAAATRLAGVEIPAPDHRDPDRCPPEALPLLAREFGVLVWSEDWPLSARRMVVRDAALAARRRGTIRAIEDALTAFGAVFTIEEDLGEFTGTIRIRNSNVIYGALDAAKAAVREAGRASVKWTWVEGEAVTVDVAVVSAAQALRLCDTPFLLEN